MSKGYHYEEYKYELEYKKFVGTVKDKRRCDKLKAYLVNLNLPAKSKYFNCVSDVLGNFIDFFFFYLKIIIINKKIFFRYCLL